jgi:predicted Zn-dependent peptidase
MEGPILYSVPDSVRITTLPNGLRVATDRVDSVETTSLGVWSGVGTRHEPAEHNGVAHLLEHMAFKGTRRRSARDIVVEIEDVGGFLNAYTGREQTVSAASSTPIRGASRPPSMPRCWPRIPGWRSISWPTSCRTRCSTRAS